VLFDGFDYRSTQYSGTHKIGDASIVLNETVKPVTIILSANQNRHIISPSSRPNNSTHIIHCC